MSGAIQFKVKLLFNILLAAFGLFVMVFSFMIGFGSLNKPGSGLFPFVCGLVIFCLNLWEAFSASARTEKSVIHLEKLKLFALATIPLISWMLLADLLGYVVVTVICTFMLSKLMGLKGWIPPALLSAGTAVFCYILFGVFLILDLPRGFWAQ
ncbi:MAG: tripartite tricarboxylate transporter TctB family protein [Desulfobacteraceae bacterium]|nr:MAG: tripartite tricarboxylate transporter TctB family protein [Desulfobacteraceae bacterium]